jgi:hypothetical protein
MQVAPIAAGGEGEEEQEERHNFALAKDGAKIVAANKEARKPESILDADADTFLRNDCRAEKWVLLELSQVAKVDGLKLSQVRGSFPAAARLASTSVAVPAQQPLQAHNCPSPSLFLGSGCCHSSGL